MPRFPDTSPTIGAMQGSVYNALAHRLATHDGEVYPFHIGDTWMEPAPGCRMEDLSEAEHPGLHRYASVRGCRDLLDACVDHLRDRTGLAEERHNVLVSAGATGGLGAVVGAMVSPGDEVLILAPFWPLIAGIVRTFHATPVPVPVMGEVTSADELVARLASARTPRTVAVYLNTPNNPTGRVLPRAWVEALVAFARRHDLWVISDEVYDGYVYEGAHVYARPLAPERTVSAYSFSKAYGMAGNRAGFLAGPEGLLAEAAKVSTHTYYSTPTAAQIAACNALRGAATAWLANAHQLYAAAGRQAAERLGVPAPQGSTFLWLDIADHLDDRGMGGFLERAVDRGLFCAPGGSFGPYPTHLRVCFTATPPDVTARGIEVLAQLLGR
jgi:N-succinyldiaminopimelate aminotransferase